MNLAEMLSFADIHQLNRIAKYYACECSTNSKRELIQSILDKMNRTEVFEEYIAQLTVEEIRFLNSLVFDQRDAFSLEELLARAQVSRFDSAKPELSRLGTSEVNHELLSAVTMQLKPEPVKQSSRSRRKPKKQENSEQKPWSPREMVLKFAQQGWLFNGYSHHTKYLYQVPADLKRRFGETLLRSFKRQLRMVDEPSVYRDEERLLVEDIGRFLKFLYHRSAELNTDGVMYKKTQQQLFETFHVKEEPVGKGGWRFGYGRKIKDYPNRFSLIYDYCFYNGLIEEAERELTLTPAGEQLVSKGIVKDPSSVYQFWLKLYRNPIHNIQSIVHWIDRLADKWISLDALSDVLTKLIKPYYYDDPDSILRNRIVAMMMHQGLLRIGEHEEAGTVIRMTKIGSSIIKGIYVPEEDKIKLPDQDPPRRLPEIGI